MGKYGLILLNVIFCIACYGQTASDSSAYKFKLDYDVPESPAFSILDANPSKVMRGSAAKEFAVNVANNFISNSAQSTGVAVDFNPYFVFGGRLKNVKEYWHSPLKRILANTQLSFASISSDTYPNDNLISGGIRITLWDSHDLLGDKQLTTDIGQALIPNDDPLPPGSTAYKQAETVEIQELTIAYDAAKLRAKHKTGGALSIGAAIAQRALGGRLSSDSLVNFRNQAWLSWQYNFGTGFNLLSLAMYRNTMGVTESVNETILGLGARFIGTKTNVGGEITWSSEKEFLEIAANVETILVKGVILALSIGNGTDDMMSDNNQLIVKPTLKYNLSQPKK